MTGWRVRPLWVVLAVVLLYPAFELLVWTPTVMKIYCPKADTLTPLPKQRLDPYGGARSVLIIGDDIRSRSGLSGISQILDGATEKAAIPVSQVQPVELRQHLSQLANGRRFVQFNAVSASDQACAVSGRVIEDLLTVLPAPEREQAASFIRDIESRKKCVVVEFLDSIDADYVEVVSDSTIKTTAGILTVLTSTSVSWSSDGQTVSVARGGRLDPTLPVTWFVSRLISNGTVACPVHG